MSKFFINRPIFSFVIGIIIMLTGVFSIHNMPIEQYPNIAPPSVIITTSLPGATAEVLENSVTQVIEQGLTGIDSLRYFSSNSDSSGSVTITLTFEPGTDPDIAQMQVQNKAQAILPSLPQDVQTQGLLVSKSNANFLIVVGVYSEDGKMNDNQIADILLSDMKDSIARINGVGNINVFGSPYSMRIWLNPKKLFKYNLTAGDVNTAIQIQNDDVPSGQIGGLPAVSGQQINAMITSQSRLRTVEDFKKIVLKANVNGSVVYLKDVARIEKGAQSYNSIARYKGKPASGMAITPASGANALKTVAAIKEKITEYEKRLPKGLKVVYPYDSTPFTKISISNVIHTLIEAVILVFFVMYLFLQNFRATLIPTIAVPIVLLGTFAILFTFGFTINTLTMFAMVLAIGLLVDDAIVVVENVERIMEEEGASALEATKKSMSQITGALVGIAIVLSAVFIPMAFFGGSSGEIYKQFSITIVASMALSVLVAIIISPPLCSILLKHNHNKKQHVFFVKFNQFLIKSRLFYSNSSDKIIRKSTKFLIIYGVMVFGLFVIFKKLPTSFLPTEDQGTMYLMVSAPSGSTMERTLESLKKVENYFLTKEAENVEHLFTVAGFSFAGSAQNAGFGFIALKDWSKRKRPDQSVMAISGKAMGSLNKIMKDAIAFTFFPPPIRELGNSSGFDMQLLDNDGLGHEKLMNARNQLLGMSSKNPMLVGVRPNGLSDVPQFKLEIDYGKALSLGVSPTDVNQTIQTSFGSKYVNNFIDNGRIKRVYVQGEAKHRMSQKDINKWYVRNSSGGMVSLASFTKGRWIFGSPKLERFNGVPSLNIQGSSASGVSSGVAMAEMEKYVTQLPKGITFAWQGISYEEAVSQSSTVLLYCVSIMVVFLALAALYESWSIPLSVITIVPFGLIGSAAFSYVFGMSNDVYFQVALLTTIGLSAKNAILIVEFAKTLEESGMKSKDAAIESIKLRFRPIIMTSIAFMLGILPLAMATGAGSESQKAIGISVFGGVLIATFVATFFVPMFYVLIKQPFTTKRSKSLDKIAVLILVLLVSSCRFDPKYTTPDSPVQLEKNNKENNITKLKWDEYFSSKKMQDVINIALENNRDMMIAYLNLENANQQHKIAFGNLLPSISATGTMTKQGVPSAFSSFTPKTQYRATVGVSSYELDFWGRLRSLKTAAYETFLSSKEAQNLTRLTIITNTAAAYLQLSIDREMLEISQSLLSEYDRRANIMNEKFNQGSVKYSDLISAQNDYENSKITLLNYEKLVEQDVSTLLLLMGVNDKSLIPNASVLELKFNESILENLPSETLLSRPDIRAAEHDLMSANANIGAARAAFFPSISLTATYGYGTTNLSNLWSSNVWSFIPQINIPIFNGGKNIANLKVAEVQKKIKIATYEKTIQTAFSEASKELATRKFVVEQLKSSQKIANQSMNYFNVMTAKNKYGYASTLDAISSKITYLQALQSLNAQNQNYVANLITLYKVLGGGSDALYPSEDES